MVGLSYSLGLQSFKIKVGRTFPSLKNELDEKLNSCLIQNPHSDLNSGLNWTRSMLCFFVKPLQLAVPITGIGPSWRKRSEARMVIKHSIVGICYMFASFVVACWCYLIFS